MSRQLVICAMAALAVGCTRPRTEAVIVVHTYGVRIPLDVEKLHVQVADHRVTGDDLTINDAVYDQDVVLCHEGLGVGCYDVPVTAALYPGKHQPNDTVRVQIDAINTSGKPVISDAALFTFAEGQRLRLDFVLYANCLGNIACAERDQVCGPDDQCVDATTGPLGDKPDLSAIAMPDLSVDQTPPDLSGVPPGSDLAQSPPDLISTIDMAGCDSVSCGPNMTCYAGQCQPCGGVNQLCCGTSMTCSAGNLVCDGTRCVQCGTPPELCCAGNTCFSGSCTPIVDHCNYTQDMAQPPPPDMTQPFDMSMRDFGLPMSDMAVSPSD